MQSWVDGRWESYDAALRRFDATHIALATGDGDPGRYFNATQWFGHLRIDSIVPSAARNAPAPARAHRPSPAAADRPDAPVSVHGRTAVELDINLISNHSNFGEARS